jgi:parallel beta-helix repeat protein
MRLEILILASVLAAGAAKADQSSIVFPETEQDFKAGASDVPANFDNATSIFINPALRGIKSNFSKLSNCANIATRVPYQWCVDTTENKTHLLTPSGWNTALQPNFDGSRRAAASSMALIEGLSLASSYGMVCNNVDDDGPALQTAMNASVGTRLYLPAKRLCRIKSYVSIPSNTYLVGQRTTLNFDAAASHGGSLDVTMMLDGTSGNPVQNVTIDGIIFNGPGTASVNDRVRIMMQWPKHVVVRNSSFQNFGNITNLTTRATTYAHGLPVFNGNDLLIENNIFQNNVGDGLSFSNNPTHIRIRNNKVSNNWDSGIVPCTIGGTNIVVENNMVSAAVGNTAPVIVMDRCTNVTVSNNKVDSSAGSQCIRVARYADTAEINQDIKVVGNTCTGGGYISMEALGPKQGSQIVAKSGLFSVTNNTIINSSGKGILIVDSQNGSIIGNRIINAAAEGIVEESFTVPVGNNIIANNVIDGATYCQRQLAVGGSVITSSWDNNTVRNCSVTRGSFVANSSKRRD